MIPFKDNVLEYYCSGQFFNKKFGVSGEEIEQKALLGDLNSLEIFSEFGNNLGDAIKIIMLSVDPDIFVLGGSVSKSFRFFSKSMWSSIRTFPFSNSVNKIKIEVSEIDHIAILGAAALYLDAVEK